MGEIGCFMKVSILSVFLEFLILFCFNFIFSPFGLVI